MSAFRPTREEMAMMGKLIEDGMKAGYLVSVGGLPAKRDRRAYTTFWW